MSFVVGGSGSGGGGDGGGGGSGSQRHDGGSETDRKKKRYHRHTAQQIQRLESSFRECPHPDDKQRNLLSKELGLAPRQIKFWFQNRRTQLKAQHERADNSALKAENDKIRCENIAIREAIKHAICPNCGGPPVSEDPYLDEQKLRMENAHLREELERMSTVASKYMGRPISSHISTLHPMHISPLDLSMTSLTGPSLDFDLLPGSSMSTSNFAVSDMDKPIMNDIALTAMQELLRLFNTNEPLWNRADGCRDVLNLGSYENVFPRSSNRGKNHNLRIEASRSSGIVFMNAMSLVDMFMDSAKWGELFPSIVAASKTLAVVSSGMGGTYEGALHLMYEEMEVLSPLVATREFCELRYCQQIEQGSWIVVNVSYHLPQFVSHSHSYRFPSGCLIQDMPNGYSKVTWVEHTETEEKEAVHELYREMVHKGIAFGAERWVTTLQRMCERYASLLAPAASSRELGGVIPSPEGKRSMMRLAHRMVSNYCISVSRSNNTRSTVVAELNDVGVRVTAHKSPEPNGTVLSAATTFWLPNSPQNVFNFLKDERTRPQWDVLSNSNAVQEVAHIANGSHPGCCISVLRASSASQSNNMLILQESSIDSSGALVVYSPVDLSALNIAMNGDDTSYIPLLSSGFAISPDGNNNSLTAEQGGGGASTSSGRSSSSSGFGGGGSLITVGFQIMVSNLPSAKLNMESVETVNNLIGTTVHQIKTGLNNCPSASATA
ncbi:Homeobox-leucine zipper protein HDG11 [Raphanus sativus]|uniref:Homeobox-leucine zipper protein HDG11 n=1 Tax=Raphanus sativus TaxID=3726 RepID=A0A6J0KDB4_RAPSA|nr:homeobox-leucine zipper protein HDG11 [Raphanus sativus]KAJ4884457.1 Homeobox-leucine zipper protein HDG11 [Raphanus sativus]